MCVSPIAPVKLEVRLELEDCERGSERSVERAVNECYFLVISMRVSGAKGIT